MAAKKPAKAKTKQTKLKDVKVDDLTIDPSQLKSVKGGGCPHCESVASGNYIVGKPKAPAAKSGPGFGI